MGELQLRCTILGDAQACQLANMMQGVDMQNQMMLEQSQERAHNRQMEDLRRQGRSIERMFPEYYGK
jgi:hypothetical protein